MKNRIVLIIAVAVGLVAALLTKFYLSAKDDEVIAQKRAFYERHGLMEVLCYGKDVPGGMPIARADLATRKVPASGLRGQALTEADIMAVVGKKLISGHRKADLVFWGDIEGGNPTASTLAADIKRQMRAISINVSGASAVSGMVKPNDHVDVIGTFDFPSDTKSGREARLVTCTILQNVLVLATGKETAKTAALNGFNGGVGQSYSTVTLEVTPREAEMLVFAEQIKGRLTLTLRHRNDTSYEKELPKVDFSKIQSEIETLNLKRQMNVNSR